ncbi:DUF7563 family protein [Haloprofundus salinisoli]|uniref:DUF7563 family protein n=1 Tax=Haloprofundus salinisoli TaxID=2876193 RepID=UPI0031F3080F
MAAYLEPAAEQRQCLYCNNHVTERFGRVFGEHGDRVHRCPNCDTHARINRGSAAGREVRIPDPETSPGRHGGRN